ncbi:hypothetical protein AV654_17865 [Paenibacillus elgii]|uniref:Uncharacterized protein n=1 Tax=Paenibacillus elgii TaxID=189691 RepID=A0A163YF95_9BACL|nr:hypothetical protein [Paenibacillus elgii]KZE79336.1 hypothetical protein AV654_17865 [Paenibacillus elgii]
MENELTLADCPQVLQDRVKKSQQSIEGTIFSIQKWDCTPYKDKSVVVSTYRVFVQFGYEVAIFKSTKTDGGCSLDDDVTINIVNAAEIEVIARQAKWIGDDLRRILSDNPT